MNSSNSLATLKAEMKYLASVFDEKHDRFRFLSTATDEFSCVFFFQKKRYEFKANILDNYPKSPSVWFTENDEPEVVNLLESLSEKDNTTITSQIKVLVGELSRIHSTPLPEEVKKLEIPELPKDEDDVESLVSDFDSEEDSEEEFMAEDDIEMEVKAQENNNEDIKKLAVDTGADLSSEHKQTLQKWSQQQMQSNLKGTSKGTVLASARLQKELMNIWRSDSFKSKHYTVELIHDSLYEWNVRLLLPSIDSDSPLYTDLQKLKTETGKEGVLLHIRFKDGYPIEPPFVRVQEPVISKGHVFEVGGVMCMELLLRQGWSAAYTVEAVILQVAATLVRGKGRVNFNASKTEYTLQKALSGLRQLSAMGNGAWTSKFTDG